MQINWFKSEKEAHENNQVQEERDKHGNGCEAQSLINYNWYHVQSLIGNNWYLCISTINWYPNGDIHK